MNPRDGKINFTKATRDGKSHGDSAQKPDEKKNFRKSKNPSLIYCTFAAEKN